MDFISTFTHQVRQLYSNLLPIHCLVCGMSSADNVICSECAFELPRPIHACIKCGLPITQNAVCGSCLIRPLNHDVCYSPFIYKGVITRLISQFKYHHQFALTDFFAEQLLQYRGKTDLPELLIPVPLHPKKLRARGYNQSHELAKSFQKKIGLPIAHPLLRHKATQSQTGLSIKQRKQNVKKAFRIIKPNLPTHVALIDDVLTSGETANAITYLLRKSGVKTIELWTIARTIRDD